MLKVRLFGAGQAMYFDRPLAGFPNQQACLLLCYLLLNKDHPHNRERLAAVFWGNYPANTSRKYLRNALWRLRQTFASAGAPAEDYLWVTDDSVAFINSSRYWLDIEDFDQISRELQGVSSRGLSASKVNQLETAVNLCSGDLLEGIYEDWCLYDRERLRISYLNFLIKLMAYHRVNNNFEQGIHYGKQILALDRTRERVHREMMWCYWHLEDRNSAIEQYKLCCQILHDDLGVRPMPETQLLYNQIIHDRFETEGEREFFKPNQHEILQLPAPSTPSVRYAMNKLQLLRQMIHEMTMELNSLEKILNQALSEPEP